MAGVWSLLRSWLRPHRGLSQRFLPLSIGFFQAMRKLGDWLARIARRDWFTEPSAETTAALLRRCEDILQPFAAEVYRRAGLDASGNGE